TYNMLQPEISKELRTRKIETLEAKKPDIIATGNIGCMVQISAGTNIPVVHTVELLDWISTPTSSPKSLDTLKADFNC
ncbi:MAG: heterodisulfide reductase-related iron-sulfur binding cluster, partial [Paracoccaceae bacterium]|nr:heterodisulfide reductase-related iron-sulfur binding cluster [Paracoccaceae bacterium]